MKVCTACGVEYPDEVLFCQRDGTPLRSADPTKDLVGQVVADRYHVTKKLGEGGMGQVYLAEHVKMGRRCAIKIMSSGMINDPDAVSRFNREAANASRISHPNVCAIYDFGETKDGLIYLAMEFIEGKSLSDLLHDTGPLGLPRAASILSQCAEALQSAHDLGIVHRDLKPDNIMVIGSRGKDVVKVVDFGIAKATGPDSGAQKVTKTGLVVGTPEYMSPEQLSGDTLDGRSDIYSLALVFYRMITGTLPFKADSAQETMIKRLTDEPMPLAQAKPDGRFPPGLQPVMDRALARWPNDRYGTATEFSRDVVAQVGSMTGKIDTEGATQVFKSGDKGTVPATRVGTAAMEARKSAAEAEAKTAARTKKSSVPVLPIAVVVALALGGGVYAARDKLFSPAIPTGPTLPASGGTVPTSGGAGTTATTTGGTVPPGGGVGGGGGGGGGNPPHPGGGNPGGGTTPQGGVTTPTGGGGKPPGGTTDHRDGASGTVNEVLAKAVLDSYGDSVYDFPARRSAYRSQAQAYYEALLPDTTRGWAAIIVGQSYLADGDKARAREWYMKAAALNAGRFQKYVDGLDRTP